MKIIWAVALTLSAIPSLGAGNVVAAPAPQPAPTLSALFYNAAQAFWAVEPKFSIYDRPFTSLAPLAPNDPAVAGYKGAAQAAETFLAAQAKRRVPSEGIPVMLYFAAMSYHRLGDHKKTLAAIDRLLTEFPDYRRPRVDGDPFFNHDPRADLLLLKLWHSGQVKGAPTTLDELHQMARDAATIETLLKRRERIWQKMPDLDRVAPTADMLRTAALPDAVALTIAAHDAALPELAKKQGAKAVRDYLRELNRNPTAATLGAYASGKLVELDKTILAGYRGQADKATRENRWGAAVTVYQKMLEDYDGTPVADEARAGLRGATIGGYRFAAQTAATSNDFDTAKANWRQIVAQFADSPDAAEANNELKKLVPVAVNFYRAEAEKNFTPSRQIGVPQSKAREFYEKMYREEPEGAQAAYAFLHWNRALGTENKIEEALKNLAQMDQKFPDSELRAGALYSRAFLAGSPQLRRYEPAVSLLRELVEKYPDAPQAPEALWHIAFWSEPLGRTDGAIEALSQLKQRYPDSRRVPHVATQIARLQAKRAQRGR